MFMTMKSNSTLYCIFFLLSGLCFPVSKALAQCGYGGTSYCAQNAPGMTSIGNNYGCTNFYGGEYMAVTNVHPGERWRSTTCASSYDTQLTLFIEGNATAQGYNDDNGPDCATNRASLDWTSTINGSYRVLVNQFNCTTNSTNTTLYIRPVAKCEIAAESNPVFTPASGCGNGSFRMGPGAYYDLTVVANTYYDFTWTNAASQNDGFCFYPLNGNAASFYTNQSGWFSGTTTTVRVSANRTSNTWAASSAVMTYRNSQSTVGTLSNAGPIDFCDASGNFGTALTASGFTNGSVVWDWGSNNGAWSNNWMNGNTSGVCCFPKKTSNSDGNPDRIRYRVVNNGCDVTSGTVLIRNRYNEAPTSLASSQNNYCATGAPANTTLTATFPNNVNMNGTVAFYSGSCGGTLVGSATASATSSTVSVTITAPTATTTYYARYEPGTGTGCSNTACAQVTVTVTPSPTVNAGGAMTAICEGGTSGALGGSVGGSATGGTWSSSAGGTFNPNATTLNATWTAPAGYSGTATLTLTTTGMAPCAAVSANKTITVNANPTVNAGGAMTAICEGGTSGALGGSVGGGATGGTWSSSAGGTFNPNATTLNATWTAPAGFTGTATLTLTTSGGSCGTTSANKTITVNPNPTVNAGGAMTAICEGGTSGALGGSVGGSATGGTWSSSAGGTFNPNATTLNATWTPPGGYSGTATLTLTTSGGSCGTTSANKTITVNPNPTVNAGGAMTAICEGGTSAALGGSVGGGATGGTWSSSAGGTFNPNATTLNATWTPPGGYNGTATLTLTTSGGSCGTTAANKTITVNAAPTAFTPTILTNLPLCYRGNAQVEVAGAQAGTTFQLRDNTTNVGTAVLGGGTRTFLTNNLTASTSAYNILATTGAGCTLSVAVPNITVNAAPTALGTNAEQRVCYVNRNSGFVEFTASNGVLLAVNPGIQNLGYVTVTEYVGAGPIDIQACNTTQAQFNATALNRHWTISSTIAPVAPVDIRLYIGDVNVVALAAVANTNVNLDDDVSGISSLYLSKYNGPNENDTYVDNCSGVTTLYGQSGNGNVTSGIAGNTIVGASYINYTIPGFSELWLSGTNGVSPLPIVLTAFTASCEQGKVRLDWTTATEINNEKFIIERSANLVDWEWLTSVPGAGNSNQPLAYNILDARPMEGLSYYRLTQRDYDGTTKTFQPLSITCYADGKGNSLMVYPNPTTDRFTVSVTVSADAPGVLELADLNGKRIMTQKLSMTKGVNEFTYDAASLNPGTYVIYVKTEKFELKPIKLVVQ